MPARERRKTKAILMRRKESREKLTGPQTTKNPSFLFCPSLP